MKTTSDKPFSSIDPFSLVFWRSHLSLIILIPYLLGGIWQLLELVSISPVYVRFFSLSQTIPDGLMVLFILALIFLIIFVWRNRLSMELWIEKWLPVDTAIGIRSFVFILSCLITWIVVFFLLVGGGILNTNALWNSLLLTGLWSAIYLSKDRYREQEENSVKEQLSKRSFLVARLVLILMFIGCCLKVIPPTIKDVSKSLTTLSGGVNDSYYKVRIADRIGAEDTATMQVLYFNDQYLFVESDSQRYVVPFSVLFTESDSVHWSPTVDAMDNEYYDENGNQY